MVACVGIIIIHGLDGSLCRYYAWLCAVAYLRSRKGVGARATPTVRAGGGGPNLVTS